MTTSQPTPDFSFPTIASGDGPEPALHGPRIVGTTPGRPFLFLVPTTGQGQVTVSAQNLPEGLTLDSKTRIISGAVKAAGEYTVKLRAASSKGEAFRTIRIVAGPRKLALTPPMGWNSWNVWAGSISQDKVKAAADAMVASGLAAKGYAYVNIDDCWEGPARDPRTGEITTNDRFPDMKGLADYVHAKGLKIGLYSSPGPQTCGNYIGSYGHEDQDAATWAKWGFDFVKYDFCSYRDIEHQRRLEGYVQALNPEDASALRALVAKRNQLEKTHDLQAEGRKALTETRVAMEAILVKIPEHRAKVDFENRILPYAKLRQSLDKVDRDIVYSLCQYGTGNVGLWAAKPDVAGNLWRTTGDITDTWESMSDIGFGQHPIAHWAAPGHWNDPDMLVVGKLGWGPNLRPTRLTPHEQLTHITLWSILASPLLIGCDMAAMDTFTTDLLTNTEVVDVNQDPLGKQAFRVSHGGTITEVWARPLFDGTVAVGLFNRSLEPQKASITWPELSPMLFGRLPVRDLWRRKDLGLHEGYEVALPGHSAALIKVGLPRPA